MTAQQPKIYPMVFRPGAFQPDPKYFVVTVDDSTEGWDYHVSARKAAIRHQTFGIWRPSRRRALIEALNRLLWPRCTLSRAKDSAWINVQFGLRGDNLPMLADLVMGGDQRALIDVLDRMDDFSHCPSGHWLSFRFPAHWAPSALGDARPICPDCRNTGTLDYAHFAMDPCSCANAVAVMTGGEWPAEDWPDAPHPLSPPATASGNSAPTPRWPRPPASNPCFPTCLSRSSLWSLIMADRPILFSAPMPRALLDGTKTQTRRALNPQPPSWVYPNDKPGYSCLTPKGSIEFRGRYIDEAGEDHGPASKFVKLPYLKGDRLWVRETYYQRGHWEPVEGAQTKGGRQKWAFIPADYFYTFDPPAEYRKGRHHKDPATVAWHKRLGRFMPRSFSRLTLTVTDVRVERLRDISERDCRAEGLERSYVGGLLPSYRGAPELDWRLYPDAAYRDLWNHINGPAAWEANPWVVAVTFTVARHNIDAGGEA